MTDERERLIAALNTVTAVKERKRYERIVKCDEPEHVGGIGIAAGILGLSLSGTLRFIKRGAIPSREDAYGRTLILTSDLRAILAEADALSPRGVTTLKERKRARLLSAVASPVASARRRKIPESDWQQKQQVRVSEAAMILGLTDKVAWLCVVHDELPADRDDDGRPLISTDTLREILAEAEQSGARPGPTRTGQE